jgi:hypothetical protein
MSYRYRNTCSTVFSHCASIRGADLYCAFARWGGKIRFLLERFGRGCESDCNDVEIGRLGKSYMFMQALTNQTDIYGSPDMG